MQSYSQMKRKGKENKGKVQDKVIQEQTKAPNTVTGHIK